MSPLSRSRVSDCGPAPATVDLLPDQVPRRTRKKKTESGSNGDLSLPDGVRASFRERSSPKSGCYELSELDKFPGGRSLSYMCGLHLQMGRVRLVANAA